MKPHVKSAIERLQQTFQIMEQASPHDVVTLASYAKDVASGNHLVEVANAAGEIVDAARKPVVQLQSPMRHLSEAISQAGSRFRKDKQAA